MRTTLARVAYLVEQIAYTLSPSYGGGNHATKTHSKHPRQESNLAKFMLLRWFSLLLVSRVGVGRCHCCCGL